MRLQLAWNSAAANPPSAAAAPRRHCARDGARASARARRRGLKAVASVTRGHGTFPCRRLRSRATASQRSGTDGVVVGASDVVRATREFGVERLEAAVRWRRCGLSPARRRRFRGAIAATRSSSRGLRFGADDLPRSSPLNRRLGQTERLAGAARWPPARTIAACATPLPIAEESGSGPACSTSSEDIINGRSSAARPAGAVGSSDAHLAVRREHLAVTAFSAVTPRRCWPPPEPPGVPSETRQRQQACGGRRQRRAHGVEPARPGQPGPLLRRLPPLPEGPMKPACPARARPPGCVDHDLGRAGRRRASVPPLRARAHPEVECARGRRRSAGAAGALDARRGRSASWRAGVSGDPELQQPSSYTLPRGFS